MEWIYEGVQWLTTYSSYLNNLTGMYLGEPSAIIGHLQKYCAISENLNPLEVDNFEWDKLYD